MVRSLRWQYMQVYMDTHTSVYEQCAVCTVKSSPIVTRMKQ
jgi:hypothetical protein